MVADEEGGSDYLGINRSDFPKRFSATNSLSSSFVSKGMNEEQLDKIKAINKISDLIKSFTQQQEDDLDVLIDQIITEIIGYLDEPLNKAHEDGYQEGYQQGRQDEAAETTSK